MYKVQSYPASKLHSAPSLKCSLDWSISLGIHGLVISEYDIRESSPTAPPAHLFPLFQIRDSSPCVCKTNHKQKKKEKPLFIRLNQLPFNPSRLSFYKFIFSKHNGSRRYSPIQPIVIFENTNIVSRAVAVLRGESRVTGEVQFEQTSEDSPTKITYNITGMDPSSKRGFHVQYTTPPSSHH